VRLELLADLGLQRDPRVEHDAQDADHLETGVEVRVHLLDRVDEVRKAFEGEVLALHRHDDAVRAREPVQRQQAEARRAVDEDEVVVVGDLREGRAQALVAAFESDELDLGAGELAIRTDDVVAALRARLSHFRDAGVLEEDVVDAEVECALVDSRAHRGVALGVEVDDQTRRSSRARPAARLTVVVVLPTPPFWLAMQKILTDGFLLSLSQRACTYS
jgi:hypothetical protein